MLIINPTISTNFQAQKNSKTIKKDSKLSKETGQEAKLCLVLGCLATIAAATIGIKKGRVVSFAEALEKNGVEIKNQIAYIKGTDKKFTGSVSRITKSLAEKKKQQDLLMELYMRKLCIIAVGKSSEVNFIKTANYIEQVSLQMYIRVEGVKKLKKNLLYMRNMETAHKKYRV